MVFVFSMNSIMSPLESILSAIQNGPTFSNVLGWCALADCLTFYRNTQTLELIFDDPAADRRLCLSIRLRDCRGDARSLCGFDPVKNRWGEYCKPSGPFELENKRGQKALLEWLRLESVKATGWPSPEILSIYPKTLKP